MLLLISKQKCPDDAHSTSLFSEVLLTTMFCVKCHLKWQRNSANFLVRILINS